MGFAMVDFAPDTLLTEHPELVRLTVGQYHRMLASGILAEGEPVELINGCLIWKNRGLKTVNPLHAIVVSHLLKLATLVNPLGCHLRSQNPITIPPHHEPEPNAAIIYGAIGDYTENHPSIGDIACVIEVSESSLSYDRTTKLAIYAAAGIPSYIIVNLIDHCFELYQQPDSEQGLYRQTRLLNKEDQFSLSLNDDQQLAIAVADYLP